MGLDIVAVAAIGAAGPFLRGCRVISRSAMQQSHEPGPVPATGASQRPQGISHSRSDCTGGTDASPPAQTSATASKWYAQKCLA